METVAQTIGKSGFVTWMGTRSCWQALTERTMERGDRSARMHMSSNVFIPGPTPNTVRAADGSVVAAPEGWILLPPGDAALTRRVKEAGEHWVMQEKKGRKVFSRGVWAPAATIE